MSRDPIVFEKDKELGAVLSDSINFFRYNFKGLMRIALLYGLPFVFLTLLLFFVLGNDLFNWVVDDIELDPSMFFSIAFYVILSFLQGIVLASAYIGYVRLYRADPDHISDADVWNEFKRVLPYVIGISFLIGISMGLLPGLAIVLTESGMLAAGLILLFLMLPVVVYLMVPASLLYYSWPALGGSLGRQISYVFRLIRGRWLWSFGLIFIMGIMVAVAGQVLTLPIQVVMIGETLSSPEPSMDHIVFYQKLQYVASMFGNLFFTAYIVPGIALIYHALVQRREQTGLRERISRIGGQKRGVLDEQE